jgi:predicted transcriptional regulator
MADLLNAMGEGAKKTNIMYKCNLSHGQLNLYLELLQEIDLATSESVGGKTIYTATSKGREYLEKYQKLMSTLQKS